jgi:hypothetical protein
MSKEFYEIDWFWPSIAVIVLVVMFFNTQRDINRYQVAQTCLQQHKSVVYDNNNNIKECK